MKDDKRTKTELLAELEDKEQIILDLQAKLLVNSKNGGRKSQVLELLRNSENMSILNISTSLGISTKNVSSQLTYLRTDGYQIFTDPKGRKVLVETEKVEEVEEIEKTEEVE